jgi:hypothetical protein
LRKPAQRLNGLILTSDPEFKAVEKLVSVQWIACLKKESSISILTGPNDPARDMIINVVIPLPVIKNSIYN